MGRAKGFGLALLLACLSGACEHNTANTGDSGPGEVVDKCQPYGADLGPQPSWEVKTSDGDAMETPNPLSVVRELARYSHWVGLASVGADPIFVGVQPEEFRCVIGDATYTSNYVPLRIFCPIEWLKNANSAPQDAVLEGWCLRQDEPCESSLGYFPLSAENYLVFLVANCCGEQYAGASVLRMAYPVRDGVVFFGNDQTRPWNEVKEAVGAAPDEPVRTVEGKPVYQMDFPCEN